MSMSPAPNPRPAVSHRPKPPAEVLFPVVPMLDMAFQLLAFFVLTFQAPSAETHLDLDLPATPLALPGRRGGSPSRTPHGGSTPTWRTTCSSASRPTTLATCARSGWVRASCPT